MNPLCIRHCTMREALEDPELFGGILPGESWLRWRAVLIASQGEALNEAERAVYLDLTGGASEPLVSADEMWGIVGRRGGKTRAFAVLCAYLSGLVDYSAVQAPGERLKLPLLASTTKQATKAFNYVLGIFEGVPALAASLEGDPTADTIRLTTGIDIEVVPANWRTVRGETMIAALCDEVAFWRSDNSVNPDEEILEAIRPGLGTTGGPLCVFSSPYARKGEVYKAFKQNFGPDGDRDILVFKAPSLVMNPTLPQSVVTKAYKRDPAKASAEYGAEFRKDVEAYITLEAVQACMPGDLRENAPIPGLSYSAFVDLAGGGADAMTLAVAHGEGDLAVLDAVREVHGVAPHLVAQEFATLCKSYGVRDVTGDRYGGEWPRERFRDKGIQYHISARTKSEIYAAFLPKLNSQKCQLLNVPKLEAQLVSLERKTARGTGRDTIDHPQIKGSHDDVANAVAGVLCLVGESNGYDITMSWV